MTQKITGFVRMFRRILLPGLLLVSCSLESPPVDEASAEYRRPGTNILLITIDTLRADHLGSYGSAIATPNIDGITAGGTQFNHAIVQVPLTTPSHASILTGTYPQTHGIHDIGGFTLKSGVPTLASVLREAGYDTAAFIAAAVLNRRYGLDRGFVTYDDDLSASPDSSKLPGVVAEISAGEVTNRATEWLRSWIGQQSTASRHPFLLWVHYYDPHFPYDPPEPFKSLYPNDAYAGEVAYTDEQVGKLLESLRKWRLLDDTMVVLLADHGESRGEHGEVTHGVFLYDSTMHVPFIVQGPGILAGQKIAQQVRSIDILPTIADYLGLNAGNSVAGISLMPTLADGKPVPENASYMETFYPRSQMRWSDLKGLRTSQWKLIVAPQTELYQLENDPMEADNVADRYPDQINHLSQRLAELKGPSQPSDSVQYEQIDQQTLRELQSLGYVSAGSLGDLDLAESAPDPKDMVEVLKGLDRATHLMNSDQFAAAAPILREMIELDRTNPYLYQNLGLCLQETRRFEEAVEVYQQAIKNHAETDRIYAELGESYIRLGRLKPAIEVLDQSCKMNPSNLDTLSNLANAYLQMGRIEDAQRTAQAILVQKPSHARAHNILGMVQISRRQPELARKSFERAIKDDPSLAEPYMNLGLLAQLSNQRSEAIRYYRRFLEKATGQQYKEIIPKVKAELRKLGAD